MKKDTLLFTVGPLEMHQEILTKGSEPLPYFRTPDFSKVNLEAVEGIRRLVKTKEDSEVVLLTASGTGAMEAAVMNIFNKNDKVLIVVGGGFGHRFQEICEIHNIEHAVINLECGHTLSKEKLYEYENKGYTGLLVNAHETSTGVYYDLPMIGEFCKGQNITFVVDAISSLLADPYRMDEWNIGATIASSQKGLALPPGLSILAINKSTAEKILNNNVRSMYFNLKDYFSNMERGQTPFTPAVGIILQLKERIEMIEKAGLETVVENTRKLAEDFREKIVKLPFTMFSKNPSNALTAIQPMDGIDAYEIYEYLVSNYGIYLCPSGGELKSKLLRVGHMGNLRIEDNDKLINALRDMKNKGVI